MSASKYMKMLSKMDSVVTEQKNVYANTIKFGSPYLNHLFGKQEGGLPRGYSVVFYGPPKGGKSLASHLAIGWIHKNNPNDIVIKIDTEFRADGQLDPQSCALFGIDPNRLIVMQTNDPKAIFDQIEKDVDAACEAGAPIAAIVIDSLNGIQGRREKNLESIENLTIGDHALTIQTGLKRIKPVCFRRGIALIAIDQVRSEMDQHEIKRGNKLKMQAAWGAQHSIEYFIFVEENKTAAGRQDLLKRDFKNPNLKDVKEVGQTTAIKVRCRMVRSTMSGSTNGRQGEFTFDFHKGLINTHEEIFLLGTRRGVISKDGNTYSFDGKSWVGQPKTLAALAADPELCLKIEAEVARRDNAGEYDDAVGDSTESEEGFAEEEISED
jgi:RecA/RadA recombinase